MVGWTAVLLSVGLQTTGALDAELGAGQLPTVGGQPTELAATATLAPSISLLEPTPLGERFSASYTPRAYWRLPEPGMLHRPALLHLLALSYGPILKPRTEVRLQAGVAFGELDYSAVREVFGDEQTTTLDEPLQLLSLSAALTVRRTLSRRWSLTVAAPVTFSTMLSGASQSTLPAGDTVTVGIQPDVSHRLTRRDTVSVGANSTVATFGESQQLSSRVNVGWQRRLSPAVETSVMAGAGRVDVLVVDPARMASRAPEPFYFGVASAGISRRREFGSDSLMVALDARVDPILQAIRPQATLRANTSERVSQRVSVGAGIGAAVAVAPEALVGDPSETLLHASVDCTYNRSPYVFRSGIRGSIAGPHLAQPFQITEQVLMAFVGVNWSFLNAQL
jgi:hypothetical protein